MAINTVKIGLLGLGTVGGGVVEILLNIFEYLNQQLGISLILCRAVDLNPDLAKQLGLKANIYSDDVETILNDPEIDIIVELIGGLEPARTLVLRAIEAGKHIVTANKALLANYGLEIFTAAKLAKVLIGFEASVGGGIPIIRFLREGLFTSQVKEFLGILNGTCNYILSNLETQGGSILELLKQAQVLGYAELDPSFDINGIDTAHKLVIITALILGNWPQMEDIYIEGISNIILQDIKFANKFGYKIKLLAYLGKDRDQLQARVHPTLIAKKHLLAAVDSSMNAVYISSDWLGPIMLYGQGAGRRPTASSVVSDIIDIAKKIITGCQFRFLSFENILAKSKKMKIVPIAEILSKYYLRIIVHDKNKSTFEILTVIDQIFTDKGISIKTIEYKKKYTQTNMIFIAIFTYEIREKKIQGLLKILNAMPFILEPVFFIRIV